MKRFLNLLAALTLVVSMQGCGSSPVTEPENPSNPDSPAQSAVQLRLKGEIATIQPSTRVNANGFEANDKVGVYVSATGSLSTSSNMLNNEPFTYSSGNITAPAGKEVYWGTPETKLSVWAYYPYAESISNNAAYPFAVNVDQSEAADYYNSDFITAQATNLAPQAGAVNLTFNHSLSKINIILKNGTGISSDELAAAEKSLSISGAIIDGTIDLADGSATAGTTKATVTPYAFDGLNYAAIVYPQQGEVTFRIELGDDVYSYSTEVDYVAGTQYKYTFTLNTYDPQGMSLTTTDIEAWRDDENPTEETLTKETVSNIITFADPKFKEYLLNALNYEWDENLGCYCGSDKKIDANNDGEISIAEAEKVEYIRVDNLGISDMSELHYFPKLKFLLCSSNPLNSVDVSRNTALEELWCEANQLTTLNVSNNTELVTLTCSGNQLTSLDVANNTALKKLSCLKNQLTSLDVSNNTALVELNCGENQLTTLDISKNTALVELYCGSNELTALDVSKNTALESLDCRYNELTALNVSNNTALKTLKCTSNKLTSLYVSKNTALGSLYCNNNQLTSLYVSKNTALRSLYCNNNQLTSLDVSNNTALEVLECFDNNQLTSLDVSKNTALKRLECYNNHLTALDVSNNTALEVLYCLSNQLTSLDVSKNTALVYLECSYNQLTTLDVSNNTALGSLYCDNNQLTALDVSKNTALNYLDCDPMNDKYGNNLLTTLYLAQG